MIYNVLKSAPESSLNGTTVLNAVALLKGADILRVHDVKQASECIQLIDKIKLN
jgi:dihydropteroate synthase